MSALFDDQLTPDDFDANIYLRMLCQKTKVNIPSFVNVQFSHGWKTLIDEFISTIKEYPVIIKSVQDTYSVLDIRFEIEKNSKEVQVWRAIEKARINSEKTCSECGAEIGFRRRTNPLQSVCGKCTESNGKTLTWLDKF